MSEGPWGLPADLCITHWLDEVGCEFDALTDETLDLEGYDLISRYRVIITGSHPEYMTRAELDALALHSSEREVAAVEAERDSIKMKQVEYLETRIGEEFDAVISGVTDRGMYVELNETRAEGMVRMRDIGNDYFTYDEKRYRLIGERTNANGSKAFREAMIEGDWDTTVKMAKDQVAGGAHVIDVCVDYVGRDGNADMHEVASRFSTQSTVPLMIDSTEPDVVETALQHLGGRAILNSVNLEDGDAPGTRLDRFLSLAREYGAAVVCTCIDTEGQARDAEWKLRAARSIHDIAVAEGIEPFTKAELLDVHRSGPKIVTGRFSPAVQAVWMSGPKRWKLTWLNAVSTTGSPPRSSSMARESAKTMPAGRPSRSFSTLVMR